MPLLTRGTGGYGMGSEPSADVGIGDRRGAQAGLWVQESAGTNTH